MKIRKRYILLILLSILPFYKIIHFGDYCINDVDYLVVAFLSILVLVTFLSIVFFNLYQISIQRELFNYRPLLIFGVFLVALYVGLKFPDKTFLKSSMYQFSNKIDNKSSVKIILFNDNSFRFKTKYTNEICVKKGTYRFENDSLFLKLDSFSKMETILDTIYYFNKTEKKLLPKSINFSGFRLNEE